MGCITGCGRQERGIASEPETHEHLFEMLLIR
jgi:hypothetical protein